MLPFTVDQFFAVFARYNTAIWPAPIVAYLLGVIALVAAWRGGDRIVAGVLALFWLWTGVGYHWLFFAPVNEGAWLIGVFFIIQAALFFWFGLVRNALTFGVPRGWSGAVGVALIVYAMLLYPALGYAAGHVYPAMPTFGVTPCPVTIFTFGLFLLARNLPRPLLVVPVMWSLFGGSAAFLLNVPQDWVLFASGPLAVALLWLTRRKAAVA
jgi:hypothetical protein